MKKIDEKILTKENASNKEFKASIPKQEQFFTQMHKIISNYILESGKHLFELLSSQTRTNEFIKNVIPSLPLPYPQKQKKSESRLFKRNKYRIKKVDMESEKKDSGSRKK